MKLIVDGVSFQLASTYMARIWSSVLPRLALYPSLEVTLLNRGGSPRLGGIEQIDFPSYSIDSNAAADSFLIDRVCAELGADMFMSTFYTTPVTIPSVMLVNDLVPEVLGFGLKQRPWQEKQIALSYASYYACISEKTRSDLVGIYPAAKKRAIVTHCGVEMKVFRQRAEDEVLRFKQRCGLSRPYFVAVASQEQAHGQKTPSLLFRALRKVQDIAIDVVCIGEEA